MIQKKQKCGSTTYVIKYTYNIGRDPLIDSDEFYFNLIGDQWDTTIDNVTFKINMPKKFDESLLKFFSGEVGSTNSSNVEYTINGNTIIGKLNNKLKPGEALTVKLSLPKDYFVYWKFDKFSFGLIIYCLICVLIANCLWLKYGKDSPAVETVEFYPPEGHNSAEIGFLYKGEASNDSIISLLFYLASKGYLKIKQTGRITNNFKITKLKDYDGTNKIEKIFLNGLFKNERKSVNTKSLENDFYTTIDKIRKELNLMKKKIFTKGYSILQIFMIVSILLAINIKPLIEYRWESVPVALLGILFIEFIPVTIYFMILKMFNLQKKFTILLNTIFGFICISILIITAWPGMLLNTFYAATYILGIICVGVIILFIISMNKRTPYGAQILGKIKGFKRFLNVTEKAQLESLVIENSEYFYDILPYTFALGISDKWVEQFRDIAERPPFWLEIAGEFNLESFGTSIEKTMKYTANIMSSRPPKKKVFKNSSSNHTSSSNNYSPSRSSGFSGGGSGGGGGSRW